ncbi:MAG TPA: ribosome assembly factor SBDS [Candidatus Poseidoniales archaeon]|nr:ribosome assembly factor SBDS [Candidatus Poseidoniales archaeon]
MVSLDDAVIARIDRHGQRFEILVDPEGVQRWKESAEEIEILSLLAVEEVWTSAREAERVPEADLEKAFGSTDLAVITDHILAKGNIQLTTQQRKEMVEQKRKRLIVAIVEAAVDPKTGLPHPATRIDQALDEVKYLIDPFKSDNILYQEAVKILRPVIPLSFEECKMAIKVPHHAYGPASRLLRGSTQQDEWTPDGSWVAVIEIPRARRDVILGRLAKISSDVESRDL